MKTAFRWVFPLLLALLAFQAASCTMFVIKEGVKEVKKLEEEEKEKKARKERMQREEKQRERQEQMMRATGTSGTALLPECGCAKWDCLSF
jgi:hypothetical protein